MTATLHIENSVHDYAAWRGAFDKFDRFRRDGGVRHLRLTRPVDEPATVIVDLDFDTIDEAEAFRDKLAKVWATPQSREQLAEHATAVVRHLMDDQALHQD